jgi:tRNA threonylcarbamoyladenosine biosynthesis protein TsaB
MSDRLVLALETSGPGGGVALGRLAGRSAPPVARTCGPDRRQTAELLVLIRDVLRETGGSAADIKLCCFSQGPGSFTGLRIACTVAAMLHSTVGCDVVGVPTLAVIARNALAHPTRPARIAVVRDARGGRVFAALYEPAEDDALAEARPAGVHDAAAWFASLPRPCAVIGDGLLRHADTAARFGLGLVEEAYWPPQPAEVLREGIRRAERGEICSPGAIVPLYLRPPECEEVYEHRRAAARRRRGE